MLGLLFWREPEEKVLSGLCFSCWEWLNLALPAKLTCQIILLSDDSLTYRSKLTSACRRQRRIEEETAKQHKLQSLKMHYFSGHCRETLSLPFFGSLLWEKLDLADDSI